MRSILYLTEILPFPTNSGGKIKSLNTISLLSKKYDVHVVCFITTKKELVLIPKLEVLLKCKIYPIFSVRRSSAFKASFARILTNYLRLRPMLTDSLFSIKFKQKVDELIKNNHIDVIHVDHTFMAIYLPDVKNEVWVLEEHNIEHQIYLDLFRSASRLKQKLFYFLESLLIKRLEKKYLRKFDYVLAISEEDKLKIEKISNKNNVDIYLPIYKPNIKNRSLKKINQKNDLLFIGDLFWPPNREAVEWFITQVMPIISKHDPQIKFVVVGKGEELIDYPLPPNVKLMGFVADLKDLINSQNWIFVLPVLSGSGVRIKVLTAMSLGIPIVSTTKGVSGLPLSGNECVISDPDKNIFASEVLGLIDDLPRQEACVKSADKYLVNYHGLDAQRSFVNLYQKIIH